jgi:ABC-type branched-subunit amino acid transport system substrate-binding protein
LRDYNLYLSSNPSSPIREAVLSTAGTAAERAGDFRAALGLYNTLAKEYPGGSYARQAAERLPQVYLAMNRPKEALEAARAAVGGLSGEGQAAMRLVEAGSLYLLGRYSEAGQTYLAVQSAADTTTRNQAIQGLAASLEHLSQEELSNIARQYGSNYPGPEAVWFMAFQSAKSGDMATYQAQAQYFLNYFPTHPWAASLASLGTSPASVPSPSASFNPAQYVPPAGAGGVQGAGGMLTAGPIPQGMVIAAILPLSQDNSAPFSQEILAGLRIAINKSGAPISIRELDTEGKPANAVRLVSEAADDPTVIAVVGPINSPEALAAAQTAQQVGIPLIAISQRLGITQDRNYVFRIFLTPKHQAESVARYAVLDKGHKSLAALYPNDSYGQNMLAYFQAEAVRLGAQVLVQDTYDFQTGNWKDAVDRVSGGQSVRRASTSYQAPTSYTAMYLPDSARVVSLILAQMAYNDVTRMEYLGSLLWVTPDLPQNSGRYLKDSAIPVPFSSLSRSPEALALSETYMANTGKNPGQFAAYGYDAGVAILTALGSGGTNRVNLGRALLLQTSFPGATGPFSFDSQGEYRVEPVFLTVKGTEFTLLKEAGPFRNP